MKKSLWHPNLTPVKAIESSFLDQPIQATNSGLWTLEWSANTKRLHGTSDQAMHLMCLYALGMEVIVSLSLLMRNTAATIRRHCYNANVLKPQPMPRIFSQQEAVTSAEAVKRFDWGYDS